MALRHRLAELGAQPEHISHLCELAALGSTRDRVFRLYHEVCIIRNMSQRGLFAATIAWSHVSRLHDQRFTDRTECWRNARNARVPRWRLLLAGL